MTVAIVFAVFTLAGFFGVPALLRYAVANQVSTKLNRKTSVAKVRFNPYTLRLRLDRLHIDERGKTEPFVDIGHLDLRASWKSLFRLAPVIKEVKVDQPILHLTRVAEHRFNFSDLLEPLSPNPPPAAASKPRRFAVSNIRVNGGEVYFDDQVLGKQHVVDHIQLGVPFIANLPADVDTFVQPLLQMAIDGSPLRMAGESKPFGPSRESDLDLKLSALDLTRYLGYVPQKLPVKIPQATLSLDLQIKFIEEQSKPRLALAGTMTLDGLRVRNAADAALAELKRAKLVMGDVQPLENIAHLQAIDIDGLTSHLTRNRDGTTNWSSVTAGGSSSGAQPAPAPPPAQRSPFDLSLASFELSNSGIDLLDQSGQTPAQIALNPIHISVRHFQTTGQTPADYDLSANVSGGGTIRAKGTFNLPQSQAPMQVAIEQLNLRPLQAFAQSALAGSLTAGTLSAHANVLASTGNGHFNVHAAPADIALDNVELRDTGGQSPVKWNRISVSIGQVDLGSKQALVNEVRVDRLALLVRRERHGEINLVSLVHSSPPGTNSSRAPAPQASKRIKSRSSSNHSVAAARPSGNSTNLSSAGSPPSASAQSRWQYRINSVAIEKTAINVSDETTPKEAPIVLEPVNLHLKDLSNDLSKPITADLDGIVNRRGSFKIRGTATIAPLKANLRFNTRRLQLAGLDPYVKDRLNAKIASATLTMNGTAGVAQVRGGIRAGYRGDVTLGNVHMLDRLTGDSFLRWNALAINGINFGYSPAPLKLNIAAIALNDFYARVILNSNGHLNLADITGNAKAAPTSLTRPESPNGAPPPKVAPSPPPQAQAAPSPAAKPPAAPPKPIDANIEISRITLNRGNINYTDNFIKPNYSADLTQLAGSIGRFGTRSATPADVQLDGKVNGNSPIAISGSMNPLAPLAFVDIKAKADSIELTGLTPYSTKYTGYPITKGSLTLDVHYLLSQQNLSATNHIFIDQLTFGDKVATPSVLNLPVRLAISLLKDPKGQINLDLPVSGSLSDPQFSVGQVILEVLKNLILKAVTSPFSLLASAFSSGSSQQLNYIEFPSGFATLTPDSRSRLDTIAKALNGRPGLQLEISGRVDPKFDRDGLRDAIVANEIVDQKIKDQGISAGTGRNDIRVMPDEYDKYLRRAYKAADFPKPTNFVGMTKSLPPDEMKTLMIANTHPTDKDLSWLAEARASAVRKWLNGKVDSSRLSITAPKLNADGINDQGKTTRVDLSLK